MDTEEILRLMRAAMPMGITIAYCKELDIEPRSLASIVEGAKFKIGYPKSWDSLSGKAEGPEKIISDYLAQESIIAQKRQKKTKAMVDVDIKPMISFIKAIETPDYPFALEMNLRAGSDANLSPELVIKTFNDFAGLNVLREDIRVERENLYFQPCIPHTLGLHLDYEGEKK